MWKLLHLNVILLQLVWCLFKGLNGSLSHQTLKHRLLNLLTLMFQLCFGLLGTQSSSNSHRTLILNRFDHMLSLLVLLLRQICLWIALYLIAFSLNCSFLSCYGYLSRSRWHWFWKNGRCDTSQMRRLIILCMICILEWRHAVYSIETVHGAGKERCRAIVVIVGV